MAFDQSLFAPIGPNSSQSPRLWSYQTTDTLETVNTDGYFDAKAYQVSVGDLIFVVVGTTLNMLEVTSNTPTSSPAVVTASFFSRVNGFYGIGTDDPTCELHIKTATGLVCARLESDDADSGVMQLQLYNDSDKELSLGKLGSNTVAASFGIGSGAILNREGNFNIISDSNDPIIFWTDSTDAQSLAATEKMRLAADGTLYFSNGGGLIYGEIYASDQAVNTSFGGTGQGNKVQLTVFGTNGESNGMTPDHTNDHIIVDSAGKYLVSVSLTLESTVAVSSTIGSSLYINNGDTEKANIHFHRRLTGTNDTGSVTMSGIVDFAESDTAEIWVWNETNTNSVLISDVTLSMINVGN